MSEDYILIGGGLLIALVIMHGIWQAWRARQDPLPLDLASEVPDEEFDLDALGPDFPNGGARVVPRVERRGDTAPTQRPLAFEAAAPVLMEVVDEEATAVEIVNVAEAEIASDPRNGSASADSNLQGSGLNLSWRMQATRLCPRAVCAASSDPYIVSQKHRMGMSLRKQTIARSWQSTSLPVEADVSAVPTFGRHSSAMA